MDLYCMLQRWCGVDTDLYCMLQRRYGESVRTYIVCFKDGVESRYGPILYASKMVWRVDTDLYCMPLLQRFHSVESEHSSHLRQSLHYTPYSWHSVSVVSSLHSKPLPTNKYQPHIEIYKQLQTAKGIDNLGSLQLSNTLGALVVTIFLINQLFLPFCYMTFQCLTTTLT